MDSYTLNTSHYLTTGGEAEDFGDHKVFSGIEWDQSSRNIL